MEAKINELITATISGEWGEEAIMGEGVKVIRTANFTNLGVINFENIVYRKIDPNKINQKKLLVGDIIIEKSGGSPSQPVGRVVFFEYMGDEDFLCNNFTAILRPNSKKVYPKFLFYLLYIGHIRGRTLMYQNKTTGILNLKLDKYLNEKINLPSLSEQIKITTILSKAEVLIKKRKETVDLLDKFLKSTFLKMFGDTVRNEKGWEKVPLKKFGNVITGNTPPRVDLENYSDTFIEWIKTDNILYDNVFVTKANEFLSEKGLKKSRFVEKGALLVACIAGSIESVGRASLTDRTVSFNQQINAIQPNVEINSLFLYWLFKNAKSYIQNHATKGMKRIITKGEFEKILMIKPPLELQVQFAQIAEKSELLKRKLKNSLFELENLYSSLSQKAFKGELNLERFILNDEINSADQKKVQVNQQVIIPEINKIIETANDVQKIIDRQTDIAQQASKYIKQFEQFAKFVSPDIEAANEFQKIFTTKSDYLQQVTKITKQFEEFEKFIAPIKNLPQIPPAVVEAQKALARIKSFFPRDYFFQEKNIKTKIEWDKVSPQQIANWIKVRYKDKGYHFNSEMLIRFLMNEYITFPQYYSSEELKKNPSSNDAYDLKKFISSSVSNENPFLKMEQVFYDAEKENIKLKITEEDYDLIKDLSPTDRSGIYFNIIE